MGWDIVCLKFIASFVAHEVLMGDMLAEAQSCSSHLHQNLSKTLIPKIAFSRSCWGSIAEDLTLRAGILSILFMDIHTPQRWEASQVHSKHFNVCWMNAWKKSAPTFLIQSSSGKQAWECAKTESWAEQCLVELISLGVGEAVWQEGKKKGIWKIMFLGICDVPMTHKNELGHLEG